MGEEPPVTLAGETSGREEMDSAPSLRSQRRQRPWQSREAGSSLSPGEVRNGWAWAPKETMVPAELLVPRWSTPGLLQDRQSVARRGRKDAVQ